MSTVLNGNLSKDKLKNLFKDQIKFEDYTHLSEHPDLANAYAEIERREAEYTKAKEREERLRADSDNPALAEIHIMMEEREESLNRILNDNKVAFDADKNLNNFTGTIEEGIGIE